MTWNGRNGRYHSLTSDDSNWLLKEQPQQTMPLEPTIKPNADFDRPNIQVNNGGFVPREVDESEPF
jgi:hypothetical protein